MTSGTRIVVLAKPPRHGECKSRLAAGIGPGAAARCARAFLQDTWSTVSAWVSAQPDLDLVFAQAGNPEDFPLLVPTPTIVRQAEGDLGRRMATLVAGALGQRAQALLLGADSPTLPETHLAAAVAALARADVVLGPDRDGGFWCLGVRGGPQALWGNTWLDDLDWSIDATRVQVEERVRRMGLRLAHAPEWHDTDRHEDLALLGAELRADPERAPQTLAALEALAPAGATSAPAPDAGGPAAPAPGAPLLSIIVAALDESIGLDACLEALRAQPGPTEIIVADGGSTDRSPERAAAAGVPVVVTAAGRGRQFAAGARMATGDLFLFVHADARLPPDGTRLLREALAVSRASAAAPADAGAFVTHTIADPRFPNRAGPLLRLADIRSRFTRHPYGDQALFMTRAAYAAVGGFRSLPIMEDYDLSLRLARRGPLARIRTPVRVSGRRMQTRPLRSALLMRLIPPLYRMGVDPVRLARLYRRW